ncbi:MAG: MFS transporter [Hyphomicrobiales bacterium]|nr:MAG: MFS transporter [Hyphomicrobiales bacterium]
MPAKSAKEPFITPELRATAFYFSIYMAGAAFNVYGGIWFADKGLSSEQIGIINAVPVLVTLLLNILVGRVADKASDWRQVIVLGCGLGALIPIGLFYVHDFWGILIIWTLALLPINVIGPVVDAATMRMTRRRGTQYGPIRAWGTVGYMVTLFAVGWIISQFGGGIFLPMFVGLSILRGLVAFGLPRFRGGEGELKPPVTGATHLGAVMKPFFLLPLVGFSMVYATHIVLNAFQALLWMEQGLSADLIAPLLALAAFAEAAIMFLFGRIARRFSARSLILLSAATAVFRWICMGFQPGLEFLIPLQLLHAFTFALGFMGCVNFIANWTSDEIAAEAQGFFQMLQQAMSVIALIAFGWLTGLMGAQAYFVAAAFAFVGAVLIWLSIAMQGPKRPAEARLG